MTDLTTRSDSLVISGASAVYDEAMPLAEIICPAGEIMMGQIRVCGMQPELGVASRQAGFVFGTNADGVAGWDVQQFEEMGMAGVFIEGDDPELPVFGFDNADPLHVKIVVTMRTTGKWVVEIAFTGSSTVTVVRV